ncbi:MAG: alpha/beta hydrolase, partial [Planctomycetes bacterium]|nr:alpha/beta hydrolase [Planctomycetota bacterium]
MLTKVVETNLGPVEYSESGAGEPILYFHGTGITGDIMIPIESPLVDDGFRLVVPNRPGYGQTPLASHTTATDCANVAAALLDVLGIDRVSVMGSSGGGAFALSFAATHPSRTKSLSLLCPQLHRWNHKDWLPATSKWTLPFLKHRILCKLLIKAYRFQLPRMSVKQFLKTEAGERFSDVANNPAAQKMCELTLAAMGQGVRFPGFENDLLVFTNEDIIEEDLSFHVPTMLIHDVCDPLAPVNHVDWFVSLVPECVRVTVHAAGHL